MQIKLKMKVEAGTDNGGEDLFLVVTATSGEEEPILTSEAFEAAWNACVADLEGGEYSSDEEGVVWREGNQLRCHPTDYEFQLDWTLDEAKKEVRKAVLDGDWLKNVRTGKYLLKEEIYIDGNAD